MSLCCLSTSGAVQSAMSGAEAACPDRRVAERASLQNTAVKPEKMVLERKKKDGQRDE